MSNTRMYTRGEHEGAASAIVDYDLPVTKADREKNKRYIKQATEQALNTQGATPFSVAAEFKAACERNSFNTGEQITGLADEMKLAPEVREVINALLEPNESID